MKLLVIEDEVSLLKSINDFFKKESFICESAVNFEEAKQKIFLHEYDCIILDINLPGGSGLQLLRLLREQNKQDGVVIISAKNSLDDKIEGLELGADDYLTKPFHLSELSARIKSLLRRKFSNGVNFIRVGGLKVFYRSGAAEFNGKTLSLTKLEYDLLLFMVNNRDRVVSRQAIAEHLSGDQACLLDSFDFVYSHIRNLKRKFREQGCQECITVVYKFGYKFEME